MAPVSGDGSSGSGGATERGQANSMVEEVGFEGASPVNSSSLPDVAPAVGVTHFSRSKLDTCARCNPLAILS